MNLFVLWKNIDVDAVSRNESGVCWHQTALEALNRNGSDKYYLTPGGSID